MAKLRNTPVWRYREILSQLGDNQDISRTIMAYGFDPPSEPSIQSWRVRNSIPGKWLPLIVDIALHSGITFDEFWKTSEPEQDPFT